MAFCFWQPRETKFEHWSGQVRSGQETEMHVVTCMQTRVIYLLVATTSLMNSAILMVTTDVVPSPSFQLSIILPPIPFKVAKIMIIKLYS